MNRDPIGTQKVKKVPSVPKIGTFVSHLHIHVKLLLPVIHEQTLACKFNLLVATAVGTLLSRPSCLKLPGLTKHLEDYLKCF